MTGQPSDPSDSSDPADPSRGGAADYLAFARTGDAAALERALRACADRAFTMARRALSCDADAEDAVQEVFLQLARSGRRFDGRVPFAAWLGRLMQIACWRVRRSHARRCRREEVAVSLSPPSAITHDDLAEAVREQVARLPQADREVIELHYFLGLAQAEVAKALGRNENAIAQRLSRARGRLRLLLERHAAGITAAAIVTALAAQPIYAAPPTLLTAAGTLSATVAADGALPATSVPLSLAQKGLLLMSTHPLAATACCLGLLATVCAVPVVMLAGEAHPLATPPPAIVAIPDDPELSNNRSGISLHWLGTKGVDYMEEYLYHDKALNDRKIVYIKSTTPILMRTNEWNVLCVGPKGYGQIIGTEGLEVDHDNDPATPPQRLTGVIRYHVDRDGTDSFRWTPTKSMELIPAYERPFSFADLRFAPDIPVLGTTGHGGQVGKNTYYRGMLDAVGDEWHTIAVGHDDSQIMPNQKAEQQASDGKEFIFVVNPRTPAMSVRASGNAQFYTTPPRQYGIPKIHAQTTYIQPGGGGVTFTLRDLAGGQVAYRINGGAWTTVREAVIADRAFTDGSNTLEYRCAGSPERIRTRTVVRNPPHPSRQELHGDFLWVDAAEFKRVTARLERPPYKECWDKLLTSDDRTFQAMWDRNGLQNWRRPWFSTEKGFSGMHPAVGGAATNNAFIAAVKGWDYKRPGKDKSFGRYAKEMVLRNLWGRLDAIRFYGNQSNGANPSAEVVGAGYYMIKQIFDAVPAYDILAGRFRSDQVADGITPIEDLYLRDTLALAAAQMVPGLAERGAGKEPGLWGTARIVGALMVAAALPEYSTPYYGTSGFGKAAAPTGVLSWKTLYTTTKQMSATYPGTDKPVFDPEEKALWREGGIWGGPNLGYFNLLNQSLTIMLNINARYAPQTKYPVIEQGLLNAINGTITSIKGQPGSYQAQLCLGNRYLPVLGPASVKAIKERNQESSEVAEAGGVMGLVWYDDELAAGKP